MQQPARFDMYALIHKALRAYMSHTLSELGRMDPHDTSEVSASMNELRRLLSLCRVHLEHENDFIHAALTAKQRGAALVTQEDHAKHAREIEALVSESMRLELLPVSDRARAAEQLYRHLASFVGENLEHMAVEERENNEVLWAHYTDTELEAIDRQLRASVAPEDMALALRWLMPSINPVERARMLGGMRQGMPNAVFERVLEDVRSLLRPSEWRKLQASLGLLRDSGAPAQTPA